MKTIKNFEVKYIDDKKLKKKFLRIKYIGDDKTIDKCECILDSHFATYHLLNELLKKDETL